MISWTHLGRRAPEQPPQPPVHSLRVLALPGEEVNETKSRTAEVYDAYERITSHVDSSPLMDDRVQRLRKRRVCLGTTGSEHTGGGHGDGSDRVHRSFHSPDVATETLNRGYTRYEA